MLVVTFLYSGVLGGWRALVSDFPSYYYSARLFRSGHSMARVYEWEWLQRQNDHLGGTSVISYVPQPPLSFVPLLPLTGFEPLTAKRIWILLNLAMLAATIALLSSLARLPLRTTTLLALLAVVPLRSNFLLGQYYVLTLFLIVAALWAYRRGSASLSALPVALGAALKLYPVLFVIYYARKRQWRALVWLLVLAALAFALAVPLVGIAPVQTFLFEVLPRAPRGELINGFDLRNQSVTVLLNHLFLFQPDLNPHPVTHAPVLYSWLQPLLGALVLTLGFFTISKRRDDDGDVLDWAVLTTVLLAMSSIPVSYHYCLLIAPAVIGIAYFFRHGHAIAAAAILAGYLLVSLPIPTFASDNPWLAIFHMPRLIGVMVMLGTFCVLRMERLDSGRALSFAALLAVVAAPGIVSNSRHFRQTDPWEPVPLPGQYASMEPAASRDRLLFVTIDGGYVVRNSSGTRLTPVGRDAFHPTVARSGDAWAEVGGAPSQIWKLASASGPPQYVVDGESPSVSPDGRWLALIRDEKLWLRSMSDGREAAVELPGWKVMESTLSDRQLVFSAMQGRETAIFRMAVDAREKPALLLRGAVRYPALAPGDDGLAFSRREGAAWHLWLLDWKTGSKTRLTAADCNAIAPAWALEDGRLYYANDCGRGLGLTAVYVIPRAAIDKLLAAPP